jgi:outer membrane protein insertion porin family
MAAMARGGHGRQGFERDERRVERPRLSRKIGRIAAVALFAGLLPATLLAQVAPPPPATRPAPASIVSPELTGRPVRGIRISGNTQVSTAVILNLIRTRQGEPFDPATVEEDYRRVYDMRKFTNVEARVEPTDDGGVIVSYTVTEQRQIKDVKFVGNAHADAPALRDLIDVKTGESIDRFRINVARESIEAYYRERNFPFAHVDIDDKALAESGTLTFKVTEGPNVKIRKVKFIGNRSYTGERLGGLVKTGSWFFIFRPGTFNADVVDQDVAALRRFYESKGFFDVRVGHKLVFSPDGTELMVEFVIDEGVRYTLDRVTFRGNKTLNDEALRTGLRLAPGRYYDSELLQRDVRQIVRSYSPYGFIFDAEGTNPEYLHVETKNVFRREAGKVEVVYEISEGNRFTLGRILVKGNWKTQDKVVLREMRVAPGQTYDSGEVADATDRLRGTPFFQGVTMTPIGDDPNVRDLLVEVDEGKTANFSIGAGVNSNGGIGGNVTFEQKNFDIGNLPDRPSDFLDDRAFTGAGQNLRISLEPGTEQTNASIRFSEPYLFDQPYSFSGEAYLRDRERDVYNDDRVGGRVAFGKRFDYIRSALLSFRAEQVEITDIDDPGQRAFDIIQEQGFNALTSVGIQLRRDTTNRGLMTYKGSVLSGGIEFFGALGGDYSFQKLSVGWDRFITLHEDLTDRKTILVLHADTGYIFDEAPFFERFYAGGIGSIRGFNFRGISPRSGIDDDAIGGNFLLTGTAEVSFPLAGEMLRGVTFVDAGTVERNFEINTIRSSIGVGFRMTLPILGPTPLAVDFALPMTKSDKDDIQYISFSFGFSP